jgi:hypothetical protein
MAIRSVNKYLCSNTCTQSIYYKLRDKISEGIISVPESHTKAQYTLN